MNQSSKDDAKNAEQKPASAPSISLPKGGGAIRGVGEKFAANPVTGTGSMSVPIATSPGRSGFGPQLSLSYDSGAGNGAFALGWNLSLPVITRKTDKGLPSYQDADEADIFILSGAEDLVPMLLLDAAGKPLPDVNGHPPFVETIQNNYKVRRYRPRIEGLFARIEKWTALDGSDVYWRSISKDNITTCYGKTAESRIADPNDTTRIFSWLICESYDDKGNAIRYQYKAENAEGIDLSAVNEKNRSRTAQRYLKRVHYGNKTPYQRNENLALRSDWMFEAVFDYGEHYVEDDQGQPVVIDINDNQRPWAVRQDPFSSCRSGFEIRTYRLCQRVLMFHHFPDELERDDYLVRATHFLITPDVSTSFITGVMQSAYQWQAATARYQKKSLPPVEFEYSQAVIDETIRELDASSLENLPYGLDGANYQWVDLHGEGLSGILTQQSGAWFYKRNLGAMPVSAEHENTRYTARFAAVECLPARPSLASLKSGHQLLDLAGDGQLDVVTFDGPAPGFFEHTSDADWENFKPFKSLPNIAWNDPNLRFIDLTGDGHADILITENDVFTWYESLAEEGFGPADKIFQPFDDEDAARLVFADGVQSIYLADFSGDGLTDLVRIRNGEVCYWPNLGYGRFAKKIIMNNAPWFDASDQFEQKRIRLADINGSGVVDILYLGRDGVDIYYNHAGNSWSGARKLNAFPRIDNLASIMTTDLFGNGTACLVWSSPLPGNARQPLRYIDLMGGQKPHLLIKTVNNLGAETRMRYAPSTQFYLADKLAGKPWITKLPFPVHCVERVETYDHISRNRFVTHYAYHHGYFDGVEREFRGFGMVEQFDTEEFAALTGDGALPASNIDMASHMPPVHTKTWFHTGIYLGRDRVSNYFAGLLDTRDAGEYYPQTRSGDAVSDAAIKALLLDDTVLPAGLTLEEEREACRALKGAMLRQEIYALDGMAKAAHPYSVTEQNFSIQCLQPRSAERYGVFFTHPREAISYHYDRNPADPRIGHALTLQVDAFGNVRKALNIAYGRRQADVNLPTQADRDKQTATFITYIENNITNEINQPDMYRAPLPSESRTYELTGYRPANNANRFSFNEWVENNFALLQQAVEINYETGADQNLKQKRVIEHVRTVYRNNAMTALLPLGVMESLALPGESYKLALTPGLAQQIYVNSGKLSNTELDSILTGEGRYVHSEGDANWWLPSGRIFFSPGSTDTPAQELAHAHAHFFLPHRSRDPFHTEAVSTESFIRYDAYDLLITETRDALANRITVESNDYRVLQPRLMSDPNRNQSAVAFDILGMVAGTAVMGKALPAVVEGDSLTDFVADLTQAQLDDFYNAADPHTLANDLLQHASSRIIYDVDRFLRSQRAHPQDPTQWLPPYAATLVRETHASAALPAQGLKIQISFSYSDGFGREIQNKIQAEPGPLINDGPVVNPRWVGSGWSIFNNKGKPVRQYEPFFSSTHHHEFGVQVGVSPVLFYDPVERVVATLHPNHTWEKVMADPWRVESWDVNDTARIADPRMDTDVGDFFRRLPATEFLPTWYAQRETGVLGAHEQSAAKQTEMHAATPAIAYADSLGRMFLTIAHNRFINSNAPPAEPPDEEFYATRVVFDTEGNQRDVIDANHRSVMHYNYDMLGSPIYQSSMEAGERWMLNDAAGQPLRAWDNREHQFRTQYDALHRPTETFLRTGTSAEILIGRSVYGESRPNPELKNQRGKVIQVFDQAGVISSDDYDFKGNARSSTRQLARDYKNSIDWHNAVPLEADIYTSSTRFDALNRPLSVTAPDNSIYRPSFNEANLLEKVDVHLQGANVATTFVSNIDYDAKGQRARIDYGNNVSTDYDYDPLTLRLINLKTRRNTDQALLQNLSYTYDPAGNITHIQDDAQQTHYFNNQVVTPSNDYVYDAVYRLIQAQGREHIGQVDQPETTWNDASRVNLQHPQNGVAMRNYSEHYVYDAVGNFEQLIHRFANGGWTREYAYAEPSLLEPAKNNNRLSTTHIGQTTEHYAYDAHGNMTTLPHLSLMQWDFKDQLHATARQVVNNGTPEITYYVYDGSGQRLRKITERQNGTRKNERTYLGGFEVYREYANNGSDVTLQRESLHVMDDQQRIALVETRTQGIDDSPAQLMRYQFGNHLGSASLELDDVGQIISYEEYYPYGSTSYQAGRSVAEVSLKRYRYTGMERDEESGLAYHTARYYAAWLGRWLSADPAGIFGGLNLYVYGFDSPTRLIDVSGMQPDPAINLPQDAEGNYVLPGEVIEIHSTAPGTAPDSLDRAVKNKIADAMTRIEMQRQETFEYERQPGALTIRERAKYYRENPDQESVYYEGLQKRHNAYWNAEEVTLRKNYRRIDAAANVGNAIGVVTVAGVGLFVGGAGLIAVESSPGAYALGASIYGSAPKVLAGTLLYGILAPPGAPDLPGPGDDVGRLTRSAGSKVDEIASVAAGPSGSHAAADIATDAGNVLSGHGTLLPGPGPVVPAGTSVTVHAPAGQEISNGLGNFIELGQSAPQSFAKTFMPGQTLPNLVLHPPSGLAIAGSPTTVGQATRIGDLLTPNMGNVQWAACLKDSACNYVFTIFGPIKK